MKNLCKKAGIKYFRFHALRHAGSSLMNASNVPIGAIQRIFGHENRTTTEIYLHSIGDSEKLAMAVYEQARQKKSHADSCSEKSGAGAGRRASQNKKGCGLLPQPLDFPGGP